MDFRRMWMNLEEEVEEEAEERDFYFLDTLLAIMETLEQLEADGQLVEYTLEKFHRDVNCDYGIAWGLLKGQLEELLEEGDSIDIEELYNNMNDIESSLVR